MPGLRIRLLTVLRFEPAMLAKELNAPMQLVLTLECYSSLCTSYLRDTVVMLDRRSNKCKFSSSLWPLPSMYLFLLVDI